MVYFYSLCVFLQFPDFLRTYMALVIRLLSHSAINAISVKQEGGTSAEMGVSAGLREPGWSPTQEAGRLLKQQMEARWCSLPLQRLLNP